MVRPNFHVKFSKLKLAFVAKDNLIPRFFGIFFNIRPDRAEFKPQLTSELILNICKCIPRHSCKPEFTVSALGTIDCYFEATWRLESYEKMSFTLSLTFMAEGLSLPWLLVHR